MPYPRREGAFGRAEFRGQSIGQAANIGLVLVVGNSQINRIVVSRIAERVGLKVLSETPDGAQLALETQLPGTVILDGGADNRECERLMERLAEQRRISAPMPFVILLSTTNPSADQPPKGGTIDAIVAKPITPERLQPLIQSMVDRVRD